MLSEKGRGGERRGPKGEFGEETKRKVSLRRYSRGLGDELAEEGPPKPRREVSLEGKLSQLGAYKAEHSIFNFPFVLLKLLNLFK